LECMHDKIKRKIYTVFAELRKTCIAPQIMEFGDKNK